MVVLLPFHNFSKALSMEKYFCLNKELVCESIKCICVTALFIKKKLPCPKNRIRSCVFKAARNASLTKSCRLRKYEHTVVSRWFSCVFVFLCSTSLHTALSLSKKCCIERCNALGSEGYCSKWSADFRNSTVSTRLSSIELKKSSDQM